MYTWSIAGVLDKLRLLERLTRPPRLGHDVDAPVGCACADEKAGPELLWPPRFRYPLDGAQQLTDKEAEEEVTEPRTGPHCVHGSPITCVYCGNAAAVFIAYGEVDEAVCIDCALFQEVRIAGGEPRLSDDELVAVRGLLQERYGDQWLKADRRDAEMWRAVVGQPLHDDPRLAHLCLCRECSPHLHASAAATGPSAADLPSEVDGSPPCHPSEGHLDPSLGSVGARHDEGPTVSGIPEPPVGQPNLADWLQPAVATILDQHRHATKTVRNRACSCDMSKAMDGDDWLDHTSALIAAHIARCLPDFPGRINQPT